MKKTKFFSDFSAKVEAAWIMQRTSEQKSVTPLNLITVLIEMMMFLNGVIAQFVDQCL